MRLLQEGVATKLLQVVVVMRLLQEVEVTRLLQEVEVRLPLVAAMNLPREEAVNLLVEKVPVALMKALVDHRALVQADGFGAQILVVPARQAASLRGGCGSLRAACSRGQGSGVVSAGRSCAPCLSVSTQ
jgi:hypothetical protein